MNKIGVVIVIFSFLISCDMNSNLDPQMKEGFLEVEGGKIWYKIAGANRSGAPLLCLHGGPGASHYYLRSLEELATDRPVIFYDQLGCGNSDRPLDTSLFRVDRFVEELDALVGHLELQEFHLVGQSWGTMLAVEYLSAKRPVGVKSVILSAPYLITSRWADDQRAWIEQLPQDVQDTIYKYEANGDYASPAYQEAMTVFYQKHLCRMDPWPDDLLKTFENMGIEVYSYMWGPSEFTITGILSEADVSDKLRTLDYPVLFTCGEFDEATPATTAYYQSLVPGSELKVFEGASHSHHLESKEAYFETLKEFLSRKEETK